MAIWVAFSALLLLVGALGWQVYRLTSAAKVADAHQIALQSQISSLQKDLHTLGKREVPVVPVGKRRSDVPPPAAPVASSSPYNQAIELARHGLSAGEVADRCGISRSEAELIVSLYRNSPTA